MKKIFSFTLLAGFLCLVSCGDDEESPQIVCKPMTFAGFQFGEGSVDFVYQADGRLATVEVELEDDGIEGTAVYTAQYSGSTLSALALPNDAGRYTLSYDGNARLSIVDLVFAGGIARTAYAYNGNGQLQRVDVSIQFDSGPFVEEAYTLFEYRNSTTRNPSRTTEFTYVDGVAVEVGTKDYTYDDKRSITGSSPALSVLGIVDDFFAENNVTRTVFTSAEDNEFSYGITYTYQYNEHGYPTTVIQQFDGEPSTTSTLTYECR